MEAVRKELRRLARGYARRVGQARAARWHIVLLAAAVAAACLSRVFLPLPGLAQLPQRPWLTVGIALGLYAVGWLLAFLWTRVLRPGQVDLARQLDERYAWRDETTTALNLRPPEGEQPLPGLLVAQTQGRLRELKASALAPLRSNWVWPRRLLAFLFAFVLLAPGVEGFFGPRGAGTRGRDALGTQGAEDTVAVPRPMQADFWLQSFIENPLPVEALPPETEPADVSRGGLPGKAAPGKDAPGSDAPASDAPPNDDDSKNARAQPGKDGR